MSGKRTPRIEDKEFFGFLMEADRDYLLARHINFLGGAFNLRAGFFGQAACEKYMKAVIISREQSYPATHSLTALAKECESFSDYFSLESTIEGLEIFQHFEQIGRYGGKASPKSHNTRVEKPGIKIAGVTIWTGNHIHILDALAKEIRGLIPIEPTYVDGLKGIIEGREGLLLSDSWKGESTIRDVLLRENYSFG